MKEDTDKKGSVDNGYIKSYNILLTIPYYAMYVKCKENVSTHNAHNNHHTILTSYPLNVPVSTEFLELIILLPSE